MFRGGFGPALERDGQGELAALLTRAFDSAGAAAEALPLPIEQSLADPEGRARVQALRQEAVSLRDLLTARLPAALGIPSAVTTLEAN
jgi:predicted lipoprotein